MYTVLQRKKGEQDITSAGSLFLYKAEQFLQPLLQALDAQVDKRLVRTFFDVFISILRFRNRAFGLVLSELGAYVLHAKQACAGTKRISNLLRSKKWTHELIEAYWLRQARERWEALRQSGQGVLLLWDDSVVEKPESWFSEGLCSVVSSKAKRLTKIKPGYYSPPKQRLCVPGFEWTSVVMTTLQAMPSLVCMRWWTTRGKHMSDPKSEFIRLLKRLGQVLPRYVIHVLDRGYADNAILVRLLQMNQSFIVRWKKKHNLRDVHGQLQNTAKHAHAWPIQATRVIYDAPRRRYRRVTLAYQVVFLPQHPQHALYLLVCRDSRHRQEPLYLLTTCPLTTKSQAWKTLFAYMRRWNIEQSFRFTKSELALESPRLWFWENRLKLMAIVALVYEFLLRFWRNWSSLARLWINIWCHRTGKRQSEVRLPLYRLRIALVAILSDFVAQNSG